MSDTAAPRPTPEQCEQIILAALREGDIKGVEAALICLAVQDPHRAEELIDTLEIALYLIATGAVTR